MLQNERLHAGLATESLLEALLNLGPETTDVMELPLSDADRGLLASILMREEEELTAEQVEGAIRALRRIALRRRLEEVQRELQASRSKEPEQLQALLLEKVRLKRALMAPGLSEEGPAARPA